MKQSFKGLAALGGVLLLLAGCGGGSDPGSDGTAAAPATTSQTSADSVTTNTTPATGSTSSVDTASAGSGPSADASALAVPQPTLWTGGAADIKRVDFTWTASQGAQWYELLRDPDGTGPEPRVQIGGHVQTPSYALELGLLSDEQFATYTVRACNTAGCSADSPGIANVVNNLGGYFKASNPDSGDRFGQSVAISADGSTMAVGAPGEESGSADPSDNGASRAGAVYVFTRAATGWQQQAYIKSDRPQAGALFGLHVALSADGNILVVGAPGETPRGYEETGAVHVFTRASGGWTHKQRLIANGSASGVGTSVAITPDGTTLAVGAPANSAGSGVGEAYTYAYAPAAGVWMMNGSVARGVTHVGDMFGQSVALSADGGTLAVASPGAYWAQGQDNQSVFVFQRSNGAWTPGAQLTGDVPDTGYFGRQISLSADGGTLAVGAFGEDAMTGAAYVFVRASGLWSRAAKVAAGNPQAGQQFGFSVNLSSDGSTLAVGSILESGTGRGIDPTADAAGSWAGAVYLFRRNGNTWPQTHYLKATNNSGGYALFGTSVAFSANGQALAIGAAGEAHSVGAISRIPDTSSAGLPDAGAVYLY